MFDAEKAARFREQADRLRGLITPEELVKERVYNPLAEVLETLAEMLEETETTVEGEEPTEAVAKRGRGRPRRVQ